MSVYSLLLVDDSTDTNISKPNTLRQKTCSCTLIRQHQVKGFTLLEALVVLTLTAFMAGIASMVLSSSFNSFFTAQRLSGLALEASLASKQLSHELKEAVQINTATAQHVNFSKSDGTIVDFTFGNGAIMRRQNNQVTPSLISNHLNTATFYFYDEAMANTSAPADIRFVTVALDFKHHEKKQFLIQTVYLGPR